MMGSDEKMLHSGELFRRRSGCSDGNFCENLARVGIDDWNLKSVGETNAQIRLADTCRT